MLLFILLERKTSYVTNTEKHGSGGSAKDVKHQESSKEARSVNITEICVCLSVSASFLVTQFLQRIQHIMRIVPLIDEYWINIDLLYIFCRFRGKRQKIKVQNSKRFCKNERSRYLKNISVIQFTEVDLMYLMCVTWRYG